MNLLDVFRTKKTKKTTTTKKPSVRSTYRKVFKGTLLKTIGGVTRSGIMKRPRDGKLISIKKHKAGKKSHAEMRARDPAWAARWDSFKIAKKPKTTTRRSTRRTTRRV